MMNPNINSVKVYKKVKVSHSLASVRAVGVRGSLYLGTVHESWSPSFAALSFPYLKQLLIYCWVNRERMVEPVFEITIF